MVAWQPMEKLARSGRLVEHAQARGRAPGLRGHDTATGGASDANTTSGMGVPTLDGLGPIGGNDHSPAEYLEVDSIVPRTAMLAGLLLAIARDPEVLGWRADDPRFAAADVSGERRRISSGGPWERVAGYSRAIVVGDSCWVAGTTDAGPGRQLRAPGRRRRVRHGPSSGSSSGPWPRRGSRWATSSGRGCSSPIWPTRAALSEVHGEVFGEIRPAATMVAVAGLMDPSLLVEIEAEARRG